MWASKRPIYSLSAPELIELPNVGSAKEFNLEGCIALKPDLVILPKKLKEAAATLSELGITVLLVEQNANMALSIADRAYVLETGRITMEGDAKELMDNEQVRKAYLGA